MSSTLTASISTPSTSPPDRPYQWLIHHAILLLLVVGLGFGAFYLFNNAIQKHDAAQAAQYNAQLATQTAQTAALQKQLLADETNWAKVQSELMAQNTQLSQAILKIGQQTQQQVNNDKNLSAQQAAARLADQTKAEEGEVTVQGSDVVLDLPITRTVVGDLDLLSGTQTQLADTQTQLKNETTVANNNAAEVEQQKGVIADLQAQNTEQIKSCNAQIGALKAKNRKSKIKSFLAGVGVTLAGVLGHIL